MVVNSADKLQSLVYDILWRKVPESGARSVVCRLTFESVFTFKI